MAQIAGAPFLLGVGTSTRQIVEDWHGRPHDPRLAATLHRLKVLRGALDGKRRGSFRLPVPPGQEVRVLLAALGPRMIELGLGAADGVILNHTPPADLPVGAEPATVFAFCWVAVNEDAERRVRRDLTSYVMARPYAQHYIRMGFGDAVARVQALHREGRLRDAPATLPQEMVDAFYVATEGLADRLRAYRDAGATPIVLPVTGSNPGEDVARFLAERSWEA